MTEGRTYLPTLPRRHFPRAENALIAVVQRADRKVVDFGTSGHDERSKYSNRINCSGVHFSSSESRSGSAHAAEFWWERVQMIGFWTDYPDELPFAQGIASIERPRDMDVHRA